MEVQVSALLGNYVADPPTDRLTDRVTEKIHFQLHDIQRMKWMKFFWETRLNLIMTKGLGQMQTKLLVMTDLKKDRNTDRRGYGPRERRKRSVIEMLRLSRRNLEKK